MEEDDAEVETDDGVDEGGGVEDGVEEGGGVEDEETVEDADDGVTDVTGGAL